MDSQEAFEAWAKARDEKHAGKIAANGLDYPLGHVLYECWIASRRQATEEAAKVAEREMVAADETGMAEDYAYNNACNQIASAIRNLARR